MNEHELEKPTSRDSPNSKACWVIRRVIRERPEGMTTDEIVAAVRKHWPGDRDFRGKARGAQDTRRATMAAAGQCDSVDSRK